MKKDSILKRMPLWKWLLLFFGGFIMFLLLDALSIPAGSLTNIIPLKILFILLVGCAIAALYALWVKLTEKHQAEDLKLGRLAPEIGKGLLLGLVFIGTTVGIIALCGKYEISSVQFDWTNLLILLASCFTTACAEEVLFRGIVFRMIDSRWGLWPALIVSMFTFGAMHLFNTGATIWSAVAIAIEAGLLLGAAYKFSGSLWFPIGIHWAWNFSEGPIFGCAISGGEVKTSIFTSEVFDPAIISGGSFGPEASIIAVLLGAAISTLFLLRICRSR